MNDSPIPLRPAPATPPALLLLGHALQWRLGIVVLLVVVALACSDWREWRQRTASTLPSTAALVAQLLSDDLARRASAFNRTELTVSLQPVERLGQRAPFCALVTDIHGRRMAEGCLPPLPDAQPSAAALALWLAGGRGPTWHQPLTLTLSEGVKAGMVDVQPHWTLEGRALWRRWTLLAMAGITLMLTLWAASRWVAQALAPANKVLNALDRFTAGDLQVRLPPMRLRELNRIGEGFNRMAHHQAQVHHAQRQLARHLLQAREAERRHLARELHDEMGQSLTALQAEAAAMMLMTAQTLPQAAASAQAMGRTTAQLLAGLQRVLADLRPQTLDRFGLVVALQSLASLPRRRADGSELQTVLHLPAHWTPLPPDHDVQVYRIVQEALTNALRHSGARKAEVHLERDPRGVRVTVADDATTTTDIPAPGHGLLGLHERVQALGGRLDWDQPQGGGLRLLVWLPLPAVEAGQEHGHGDGNGSAR